MFVIDECIVTRYYFCLIVDGRESQTHIVDVDSPALLVSPRKNALWISEGFRATISDLSLYLWSLNEYPLLYSYAL